MLTIEQARRWAGWRYCLVGFHEGEWCVINAHTLKTALIGPELTVEGIERGVEEVKASRWLVGGMKEYEEIVEGYREDYP